jgi:hypothetical protein
MNFFNALFNSKNVFKCLLWCHFFIITWNDGLVLKALECGEKVCGFKPYFEHSSLKKSWIWGFNGLYDIGQWCQLEESFFLIFSVESQIKGGNILDSLNMVQQK